MTPADTHPALDRNTLFIDVRSPGEFASGYLEGAVNVPLQGLPAAVRTLIAHADQAVVLYCASGMRSAQACAVLAQMGYTNVHNGGGISSLALGCGRTVRRG